MRTGQARSLLIAAARTVVQLTLLGFVLETIFATNRLSWVLLLMLAMGAVASYEVTARQKRRFSGWSGYVLGTVSMFVSTFSVLMLTLLVIVQPEPWFRAQYAIPLFWHVTGQQYDRCCSGAGSFNRWRISIACRNRSPADARYGLENSHSRSAY